jgi:hypothetical protein
MAMNVAVVRLAGSALLFVSSLAQAHYLWLESGKETARLFYGEVEEGVREKTPGKLDTIRSPQASIATGDAAALTASVVRMADHFAISLPRSASAVVVRDEAAEVRDLSAYNLGVAKTNYYARVQQASGSSRGDGPYLPLDIAPQGKNQFIVLHNGKPLIKAKLQVIAPNTWVQEHTTDREGKVAINTPWRGRYVLHVLHVDPAPGEFEGKPYQFLRNHFTYTFVQDKGAPAGPALPPQSGPD